MFLEDYDSNGSVDDQYFEAYSDLSVHEVMLGDKPRMQFYRSALSEDVVKGKIVVDVGSGSGILSCWAAQAGAAHVLAVEASSLANILPSIFKDNNLDDRVTVIHSSVEEMVSKGVEYFLNTYSYIKDIKRGISIIVSEWMGFYLLHEGMLASVIHARDFFRKVNEEILGSERMDIQMIPSRAKIFASPISLRPYQEELLHKWQNVDGVDLTHLALSSFRAKLETSSILVEALPSKCLLHEGIPCWECDVQMLQEADLNELACTTRFEFDQSACFQRYAEEVADGVAVVDGFAIWFTVTFGQHVLSTSPLDCPTHWKQTVTLLPEIYREEETVQFSRKEENNSLTIQLNLKLSDDSSSRCYSITTELIC